MDNNLLEKAINLIKSGDVDSGQSILLKLIQHDAANEAAWLWLAKTYSDNRVQYCMEKVLEINPHNEIAQAFMRKQEMLNQEVEQKKYREKIRIENLSKKYLREDGILVFKPSRTSFYWRYLPGFILFYIFSVGILVFTKSVRLDSFFIFSVALIVFGGLYYFMRTGPWYDIELSETILSGPVSYKNPFNRRTIQIQDIDLENIETFSSLLRFFIILSYDGKRIILYGFNEETLQDLTDIIHFRQISI